MKRLLWALLCLGGASFLTPAIIFAQTRSAPGIVPTSPSATSMIKGGEAQVNTYRGTPQISIPVYAVKSRTLSTSIALNYTGGSGLKVQEVAGPAGLGWALAAGMVISRTVRGVPDEDAQFGYCMTNKTVLGNDITTTAFQNGIKGLVDNEDLEPDVFSSGVGGRIIFNTAKVPRFINEQGMVIKKNGLFSADSTWEIVDNKGTRYLFGKSAQAREHSILPVSNPGVGQKGYISSWYISEVISPDGESIRFNYTKGLGSYFNYPMINKVTSVDVASGVTTIETRDQGITINIIDPVYVSEIISENCKVTFSYNDRWDVPGQKSIEKISVNDGSGNLITAFRFNNGYFPDANSNLYARSKLLSIEQFNSTQNRFIKVAGFTYNTTALPPRTSEMFDHWGYYNNNTSGKRLKSEGAIKTADATKCKAGVLTAIQWPNGGETQYEYELNSFVRNGATYQGGGLRVSKIKQVENGNVSETGYAYINADNSSSGLLQSRFNPDSGYVSISAHSITTPTFQFSGTTTIETDLPIFQVMDFNGVAVGYSRVQVTYPDQSKEIQIYQDYNSFPNKEDAVFLVSSGSFENVTNTYSPAKHGIFNFYTNAYQQRGLLKEQQLYNSSGTIVSKTVYTYKQALSPSILAVRGFQKQPYIVDGTASLWCTVMYQELTGIPQLIKKEVTSYDQDNASLTNVSVSTMAYNSAYPSLLTRAVATSSNGDSLVTVHKYPVDILSNPNAPNPEIGAYMAGLNIMDEIETITKVKSSAGEIVTSAVLNLYSGNAAKVKPSFISKLRIAAPVSDYQPLATEMAYDVRCKPEMGFDKYSAAGQLLQLHGVDNVPQSNIWGYRNEFVVATVYGATYDQAVQYVDTALLSSGTLSDAAMRAEINKIRTGLPNAEVYTYTYDPLRGNTSVTDPAGRVVYTEYDDFSRLKAVKDHNGNILKQMAYYFNTAGGWEQTATRRCLTDVNGQFTGEEEVQEIDKNTTSSTYNQTRWRSLGFTNNCNNTVYVKLARENYNLTAIQDTEIYWSLTSYDIVAYFYQDPACTIPRSVTGLNVIYKVAPETGTGPRAPVMGNKNVSCNGTRTVLASQALVKEFTVDFPPADYNYIYTLVPAAGYTIK